MPRPYGLILGEGVYGMTRRGVGLAEQGPDLGENVYGQLVGNVGPDAMGTTTAPNQGYVDPSNIPLSWKLQNLMSQYGSWLLIGGVVLFLMKRK